MDTVCQQQAPIFTLTGESPAGGTWSGVAVTGNQFDLMAAPLGYAVITYTYTDTTTNCIGSIMDSMWVDLCMATPSLTGAADAFSVYPNPNNGQFVIELNTAEAADVCVYDAIGQVVVAEKLQPGMQNQIKLESSGAYLVTVVTKDGERFSQRVIVTK